MKPTQSINYRYISIFFFLCAIVGFWNPYFTKIFDQENYCMHTHGIALSPTLLVLLLYHFSVLNFYKYHFGQSLCEWFYAI